MIGFTEYVYDLERRGERARAQDRIRQELGRIDVAAWLASLDAHRISPATAASIVEMTAPSPERDAFAQRVRDAAAHARQDAVAALPVLTAEEARALANGAGPTEEERLARAAPVLHAALSAIRSASAAGQRETRVGAPEEVAADVAVALAMTGFDVTSSEPGTLLVSWSNP